MGKIDKYIKIQKEIQKEYKGSLVGIGSNHIHIEVEYFLELFEDYTAHTGVSGFYLQTEYEDIEIVTVFDRDNLDLLSKLNPSAKKIAKEFFNEN